MRLTVNSNLLEAADCLTHRGGVRPCGQTAQVYTPNPWGLPPGSASPRLTVSIRRWLASLCLHLLACEPVMIRLPRLKELRPVRRHLCAWQVGSLPWALTPDSTHCSQRTFIISSARHQHISSAFLRSFPSLLCNGQQIETALPS